MGKYPAPEWAMKVRHIMLDRGLRISDLAKELGTTRSVMSTLFNGKMRHEALEKKVLDYFGLTNDQE